MAVSRRPANSRGRVIMPGYFSYIAKLDDPDFFWPVFSGTIFPKRVNCGASPGKGRAKQEGEAL